MAQRTLDPHRLAELRSIAFHGVVAERIAADPELVRRARHRVESWLASNHVVHYAARWSELLDGPRDRLLERLVADDDDARALRQATPFAGVLSPRERWALWREVKERFES